MVWRKRKQKRLKGEEVKCRMGDWQGRAARRKMQRKEEGMEEGRKEG